MATGRGLEPETRQGGLPEAAQPQDAGLGFLSGAGVSALVLLEKGPGAQEVHTSPGGLISGEASTEKGVTPKWCLLSKGRETFPGDICIPSCSKICDTTHCLELLPKPLPLNKLCAPHKGGVRKRGPAQCKLWTQGGHESRGRIPHCSPSIPLRSCEKQWGSGYNQGL